MQYQCQVKTEARPTCWEVVYTGSKRTAVRHLEAWQNSDERWLEIRVIKKQ